LNPQIRENIVKFFKNLGYLYITVDLEGYRTGSMNLGIKKD
ncbi:TIGR00268 family protein, partial [candidate division KSB1 bacterium]